MVQFQFEPSNERDFDLNLPVEEETQNHQATEREIVSFRKAVGFRFQPRDVELVLGYLKPLAEGRTLPENKIHRHNIYSLHPDELEVGFEKGNEQEYLFFTPRSRLGNGGERASRSAKEGFWHSTTGRKKILLGGTVIGEKQNFCFYNGKLFSGKPPKEGKTKWLVVEYRLVASNSSSNNMMEIDSNRASSNISSSETERTTMDYVLSKIYNNSDPVENYKEDYADFVKEHQELVIDDESVWKGLDQQLFSKSTHS